MLEWMNDKLDSLRRLLESYGSCLVAYSGGVDSVFLAVMAHKALGDRSLAVIADSPSLAREELQEALDIAKQFGFPVKVVRTDEFQNPDYLQNAPDRCYFCKSALFEQLKPLAGELGFSVIAYGENVDDLGDIRPGAVAARESNVRSPLREAGLTKAEIRDASRSLGLPTSDKPQMACLSSRIPHGDPVTLEKLRAVELSESFLNRNGFSGARVRCHELRHGLLARIEVQPDDWAALGDVDHCRKIEAGLRDFGFTLVTLDLGGYKRGGRAPERPASESSRQNPSGQLTENK